MSEWAHTPYPVWERTRSCELRWRSLSASCVFRAFWSTSHFTVHLTSYFTRQTICVRIHGKHNNLPFARLSTNVNPTFRVRTTNYHAFSTQIESTIVMKNFKYNEKQWKIKIGETQRVCVDSHSFSYHRVCQISDPRGAIYCCSAVTNPRCKSRQFYFAC